MDDEGKFSFIEERIGRKGSKALKKLVKKLGRGILLAVLFGTVAGLAFTLSLHYFQVMFGWDQDMEFRFTTPTPETVQNTSEPLVSAKREEVEHSENPIWMNESIDEYEKTQTSLMELANEINRSIVMVSSIVKDVDIFENPREYTDVSAGLIVAEKEGKLYILSSHKKFEDKNKLQVVFSDGFKADVNLYMQDTETGLLMLTVKKADLPIGTQEQYKVAEMGFTEQVYTGLPIMALGNPNGSMYSMDVGNVTGESNDLYIMDDKLGLYRTNLTYISDGEGFIVNLDGVVLGVISQKFSEESGQRVTSFLGVKELRLRIEQMINQKQQAYVGVIGNDILEEYAKKNGFNSGVYVSEVLTDSPAYHAGLTTGDIIVKVNETVITSMDKFYSTISRYAAKDEVTIKLLRIVDGEYAQMKVTLQLAKKKG